jgi:hypothetical protein
MGPGNRTMAGGDGEGLAGVRRKGRAGRIRESAWRNPDLLWLDRASVEAGFSRYLRKTKDLFKKMRFD